MASIDRILLADERAWNRVVEEVKAKVQGVLPKGMVVVIVHEDDLKYLERLGLLPEHLRIEVK